MQSTVIHAIICLCVWSTSHVSISLITFGFTRSFFGKLEASTAISLWWVQRAFNFTTESVAFWFPQSSILFCAPIGDSTPQFDSREGYTRPQITQHAVTLLNWAWVHEISISFRATQNSGEYSYVNIESWFPVYGWGERVFCFSILKPINLIRSKTSSNVNSILISVSFIAIEPSKCGACLLGTSPTLGLPQAQDFCVEVSWPRFIAVARPTDARLR